MTTIQESAVEQLRAILARLPSDSTMKPFVSARDQVIGRFQPMFTPAAIKELSTEEFRDFLMLRNNRHWSGLQRMLPTIIEDMVGLRSALLELADESVPVAERLDRLLPNGRARVRKLGKAVLTPILLMMHPDRYGVWNGTSQGAMEKLGIWPTAIRGESIGRLYQRVNGILLGLTKELGTDLWTLDALWWRVLNPDIGLPLPPDEEAERETIDPPEAEQRFGLERYLQQFMVDNWEQMDLSKDWVLDEVGGDIEGYGSQRRTDVGTIDLLARHRNRERWLVVELKRGQTSDETVGQVLRYMGWVKQHLAKSKSEVEGLIVALDGDERLRYALMHAPNVGFMKYEISFRLVRPPAPASPE